MKAIHSLSIVLTAAFAVACSSPKAADTQITGELLAGSKAETIQIACINGMSLDTSYVFPVTNDCFSFSIPTDKMELAVAIVRSIKGTSQAAFIPEGVPMKIFMNKQGELKVISEAKGNLTEMYNELSESINEYQRNLNIEVDSLVRARNYDQDQADSLVKDFSMDLTKYMEGQFKEAALVNKDNVIGLRCVLNLATIVSKDELSALVSKMGDDVRNHKDVLKALE